MRLDQSAGAQIGALPGAGASKWPVSARAADTHTQSSPRPRLHQRVLKDREFVELPDAPTSPPDAARPARAGGWRRAEARALAALSASRALPLHWWLLALVPFVVLAVYPRLPGPGVGADDFGQYLMHAQALASGHHYGDINYLYSPLNRWIGPANALPGLPLLLAPVLRLGGVAAVPWVMLLLAACFPLLAGRYFARHEPPLLALGAAVVCVLSPAIVFSATQALTDLPFAVAVWGLALVADADGDVGWRRVAALTALGGAALLLRTAAVAIVPALLLTALLRRHQGHGLKLALPVLAWALLGVAVLAAMGPQKLLLIHVHPSDWLRFAVRRGYVMEHAAVYSQALLDVQFEAAPHDRVALVLRALALGMTIVGVVEWMRRNPRSFLTVFAVVYAIMLLVLPFRDDRYLFPLLPLTTFGLLNAVRWMVERMARRRVALRAAVALALTLALLGTAGTAQAHRPVSFAAEPEGRGLLDYLRPLAAREHVRLVFMKPRMLAWTLGVPVMGTFEAKPQVALKELCDRRITHVITALVHADRNGPLRGLAESRPELFRLMYANRLYRVYQFSGNCTSAPAHAGAPAGSR